MFKPTKRYRPERHFMRGPGPKWLEKHGDQNQRGAAVMDGHRTDKHLLTSLFAQVARSWRRD